MTIDQARPSQCVMTPSSVLSEAPSVKTSPTAQTSSGPLPHTALTYGKTVEVRATRPLGAVTQEAPSQWTNESSPKSQRSLGPVPQSPLNPLPLGSGTSSTGDQFVPSQ